MVPGDMSHKNNIKTSAKANLGLNGDLLFLLFFTIGQVQTSRSPEKNQQSEDKPSTMETG